jgi:hypothetical protein
MTRRHPLVFIFLVVLLALAVYGAVSLATDNDEKRVRRAVNAAILGLELNDPARYGLILAEDYKDDEGYTREKLLKRLGEIFGKFRPVQVDVKRLKVRIETPDRARADVGFKAYFRKAGDPVLYQDSGKVVLSLKKVNAGWQAYHIVYTSSDDLWFIQSVA